MILIFFFGFPQAFYNEDPFMRMLFPPPHMAGCEGEAETEGQTAFPLIC
jgi:hypothetical protein